MKLTIDKVRQTFIIAREHYQNGMLANPKLEFFNLAQALLRLKPQNEAEKLQLALMLGMCDVAIREMLLWSIDHNIGEAEVKFLANFSPRWAKVLELLECKDLFK